MKITELVERFSVHARHLDEPCVGVVVHQLSIKGHDFGAVIDGESSWLVPLNFREARQFVWVVGDALYEAVESELAI